MASFYEVDIPHEKPVVFALQKLYGIGSFEAFSFCKDLGIGLDVTVSQLEKEEWHELTQAIEKHGLFEIHRRKAIRKSIESLVQLQCYRGVRHSLGLPVRGQRTKTNARTRRRRTQS